MQLVMKPGFHLAFGYESRVGKDTIADYITTAYPGTTVVRLAEGIYNIEKYIQVYLGYPCVKDPRLLQFIGGGLSDHYGEDVWLRQQLPHLEKLLGDPSANIIVVDLRRKTQFDKLKSLGFSTVRVVRDSRVVDRDPAHASECELSRETFDYTVYNNSTIPELYASVDSLVETLRPVIV